jgi:paxillin
VDAGFDYIAQLEALEKELRSYRPADSPQRSKGHSLGSSQGSSSQDSHYEVDPDYMLGKKEKSTVPPSQRVGGRPSVADFVDELTEVEDQVSRGPEDSQQTRGMTSSTATRELDELMANLENFEPASAKTDQSQSARDVGRTKSTAMDNLNSMLGSLDEDMTKRHGVKTAPKGVCAACNKPILTKVVNALGCQWHKEHFTCAQCDVELGSSTYYESNGRPYCEKDYHELFAPRCAYCNGPILERVLRALGKTWHKEHFFCTLCGKDFGPEGFHEKDSKAFCRECYYEKFAPRCKRCEQAIMEGFITALSSQWHPECFCCKVCGVTFPRGNYFDHEGEPHCEIHYHASRGTLCASCQKPVTGKCITAMGKKWHPEHFTCAFCLKLLNKGTFKEHRHNPYCQSCYIKLFG